MHQGEIIEKIVRNSGYTIGNVADISKLSRKQLYNIFKYAEVKNETILKIGRGINHDFSKEFPWLAKMYDTVPELKPKVLRTEEEQAVYLAKRRTEVTVTLDGSDELMEEGIEKIRKFNEALKNL